MRFKINLIALHAHAVIPINYNYPLSAAIYRILAKGDAEYARFLHETGYGKGFKFFTFSQIYCSFRIEGDRMRLLGGEGDFNKREGDSRRLKCFHNGIILIVNCFQIRSLN